MSLGLLGLLAALEDGLLTLVCCRSSRDDAEEGLLGLLDSSFSVIFENFRFLEIFQSWMVLLLLPIATIPMYMYIYMYMCIYLYVYICRERERERELVSYHKVYQDY